MSKILSKTLNKCFIALGIGLLFGFPSVGFSQIPTNQQILAQLFSRPIIEVLDSLAIQKKTLAVETGDSNELGKWIQEKVKQALMEENYAIYPLAGLQSKSIPVVYLKSLQTEIVYRPTKINWFLRTSRYKREIKASLLFYITGKNGSVVFTADKNLQYADEVNRSDISRIENPLYSFSVGTKLESKTIKRLVEPLIITTSTIGMVYLFFTLRSGS